MPTPLDGRPLSQTPRVADLRATDLVPLVRPSEPLPDDQNVHMRADRLQELLGGTGTLPPSSGVTLYDTLGPRTDGAATQRLVTQIANRAVNQRPGGPFQTTWFSAAQSAADPYQALSLETLLATRAQLFHLGCLITVEAPLSGAGYHYTLAYDSAPRAGAASPGLRVFKNGEMVAGELVPAMLVPADSPEAAAADYVSFAPGYVFAADQLIRAYVPGTTAQQFAARRVAGAAPAPTAALLDFTSSPNGNDTNWKFVGRNAVPATAFATITLNQYGIHPALASQTATNAYLLGRVTANVAPTIGTPSLSSTSITVGASVTATASAADSDGTVASVEYFLDGASRGSSTAGPSFPVTFTPAVTGSRLITAQATDNLGAKSVISAGATLTVNGANTAPAQVTGVSATASSPTSLYVTYTAPANGGSAITDYLYAYSANGGTSYTAFPHTATTGTAITITGLSASTAYLVRVSAINAVGTGPASATAAATTPAGQSLTANSSTPS